MTLPANFRRIARLQGTGADGGGDKRPVYTLHPNNGDTISVLANRRLLARAVGDVTRSGDTRPLYLPQECNL